MWILPKQLHTSAYVPDMAALISDSNEQSLACEQSLLARSKPSPARTWLQRWKRDTWTRHLSGRMLKPSHTPAFTGRWTSSLEAIPASPSAPQANGSAQMTPDTYGPSSQMELLQCDQNGVSLKTSRDISRWGCPTSSRTWQEWVTELRGEYSRRLNAERRISASGCSSWPTPVASEYRDQGTAWEKLSSKDKGGRILRRIANYQINGWPTPTTAEGSKIGCRANFGQKGLSNHPAIVGIPNREPLNKSGRHTPTNNNATGSPVELSKLPSSGKLNPRWVETLMGVPVGWTMPSCESPVTIEPTNSDCSAMELSPPPQNEPSQLCFRDF